MQLFYTERFRKDYAAAPLPVQKAFDKQAQLLVHNLRHPSLRAKKYDERRDIWQARVTKSYRFYFRIIGDTYEILTLDERQLLFPTCEHYFSRFSFPKILR